MKKLLEYMRKIYYEHKTENRVKDVLRSLPVHAPDVAYAVKVAYSEMLENDKAIIKILEGLPRPVTFDRKLKTYTCGQGKTYWLGKIREETSEYMMASTKEEEEKELADIATTVVSCLCVEHCLTMEEVFDLFRKTNIKNRSRNCFKGER